MKKYWQALILLGLITFLIVIRIPLLFSNGVINGKPSITIVQAQNSLPSQGEIAPTTSENTDQQDSPVTFNGETLFTYSSEVQGFSAKKRAERATQEIAAIANNFVIPIDSLTIVKLEGLRVIATEENSVFTLIEADAQAANRPLDELASEYLQKVKTAIAKYREQKEVKIPVRRIISAAIEVLAMLLLLVLLKKILNRIYRQIESWKTSLFRPLKIQNLQIFSVDQEANLLLGLVKLLYWGIVTLILFIYFSLLTRYVPQTEKLGDTIFNHLYSLFLNAGRAAIAYLPNLFSILLTVLIAAYIIRFCKIIFNAIDGGTLSIPGFYQDWARPTERLVVTLIGAFSLVVIFPLLPGADSPAFRGISIFVGALFTLGGASAIANLVGGFIIIYTRAFQTGDRVQIADVKGDILEKTILSTRIRTTKNEIITIPNANLITSNIKNFTTAMRDIEQPLIVHTIVTLGYDVPWRQVHQVLIEAALASPLILDQPAPFVLQTALGDFSVSYELNAYTNQPSLMPDIYSQLHQNIQDKCNEVGIEILSPQYSALRDGNQNTIPEDYLPQDYLAPGFRVNPFTQIFKKSAHQDHQQQPPE
ncbi:small-conductance mechanosensitive channel [Xenococcus sp. PCC 7305]|uniref:mechanosensitive ion channel family protein n=1 Tax=Xenococcus sp. PCC 7305 TaxID=102125 RepID=UPI0002ABFCD1|nr:mechanosensitive ion channel family protein [Xenococcus sp. PCC 7305]ELS04500.1 small-conductance mechanosensitive channel [Xenococcus sp. PCC 7305]